MIDAVESESSVTPLRILMVTARFLPETGGIETHVYQVATRLARLGHHVTVLTTDRSVASRTASVMDGVPVVRVPAWPRQRDYYFAPAVYAEVRDGEWDLVHIQGCHTFVPVIGMLAAIRADRKFVVSFHSGGHSSSLRNSIRKLQWTILAPLFRRADHLIGVSRFEARSFSQNMGIPAERFSVIFNGAEMPRVGKKVGGKGKMIASVGRLEKYKGHHRLIQAMPHLLRRDPDLCLRIVGDGPYKPQLEKLAETLNVAHRVEIAGVPPGHREEMANILGNAALVTLLSDYEAHPIAVMEALACGARVLVTNISGLADLVEDGLAASVEIDASDEVIASRIWSEMQVDHRRQAIQLPTWDGFVDALQAVYRSVMKGVDLPEATPSVERHDSGLISSAQVRS